jgi:hypothetical protein
MYRQAVSATPTGQPAAVVARRWSGSFVATIPSYPRPRSGNAGLAIRQTAEMLGSLPKPLRPRSVQMFTLSLGSIVLCILLWIRAKTIGEDERANAERRALFVGLWPPMFWLIGETLRRGEEREARSARRLLARLGG